MRDGRIYLSIVTRSRLRWRIIDLEIALQPEHRDADLFAVGQHSRRQHRHRAEHPGGSVAVSAAP
jgi:hypothetical protein